MDFNTVNKMTSSIRLTVTHTHELRILFVSASFYILLNYALASKCIWQYHWPRTSVSL